MFSFRFTFSPPRTIRATNGVPCKTQFSCFLISGAQEGKMKAGHTQAFRKTESARKNATQTVLTVRGELQVSTE